MCISRRIKFEEDVEEGGERWSKPHVATLALHSLFVLRSCICSAHYWNLGNSRIALRVLGIPIMPGNIGIPKTRCAILELSVRILGIGTK